MAPGYRGTEEGLHAVLQGVWEPYRLRRFRQWRASEDEVSPTPMCSWLIGVENVRSRVKRWLPALLWMGFIFFLSSQSDLPRYPHSLIDFVLKKGAHLFEYAILAILLNRAVGNEPSVWTIVVGGLYAASDELHQSFVSGRNARLSDLAIDILGLALGFHIARIMIARK